MLYNSLFEDSIRPGESLSMLQIRTNKEKLYQYLEKKYKKETCSKYQLPLSLVSDKINVISFPSTLDLSDKKERIQKIFKELYIDINYDKIISFNIDMKLSQFEKLFEHKELYKDHE